MRIRCTVNSDEEIGMKNKEGDASFFNEIAYDIK